MKGLVRVAVLLCLLLAGTSAYAACDLPWPHFSVLGFEQAGASSTQASQRFFFDFYVTRPLPYGSKSETCPTPPAANAPEENKRQYVREINQAALQKRQHWWGNVRTASYPQQVNAPIGEFATGLTTKVAEVKVNEFVQTVEFRTGFDSKILGTGGSRLSAFVDFGGVGSMDPKQSVSLFTIPAKDSIARKQFDETYKPNDYPGLGEATFVAFSTPDRSRFYRQYAGGLRYTQLTEGLAPASVSASFGQHELVSGGRMVGVVGIFEAFSPLNLGGAHAYVFGRGLMSLRKNRDTRPLFLEPAIANNKPVAPTDPGVFVISRPSERDVFTVGIGIDVVDVIKAAFSKPSN
jgi:hypothetical protein